MEQQYQDMSQKVWYDKNLDTFAAHFDQRFNQKVTPQKCCEIMKFRIPSTVNHIRSIYTWGESSCTF